MSEIYGVTDAWKYIASPTSGSGLNIDLPSSAVISYKMSKSRTATSGIGGASLLLQDNSNHMYYVGNWASTGQNGVLIRNTGSTSNLVDKTVALINANEEVTLTTIYNNNDWSYSKDSDSISFTANYTPIKLIQIDKCSVCTMTDLIIKPL